MLGPTDITLWPKAAKYDTVFKSTQVRFQGIEKLFQVFYELRWWMCFIFLTGTRFGAQMGTIWITQEDEAGESDTDDWLMMPLLK